MAMYLPIMGQVTSYRVRSSISLEDLIGKEL